MALSLAGAQIISVFSLAFTFAISLYSLYLNWKQAQVKDSVEGQHQVLLTISSQLNEIAELLGEIKKYGRG